MENLAQQGMESFQEKSIRDQFPIFWERCKSEFLQGVHDRDQLDVFLKEFKDSFIDIRSKIMAFHHEIEKIPLSVVLATWIKDMDTPGGSPWGTYFINGITKILEKGLINLTKEGRNRTIKEFNSQEHLVTIENIRCVKNLNYLEKEQCVNCYLNFSGYLNKTTLDLIPCGYDPDRRRTANKVLKYERFIEFVQHLSDRDALIAKLLYFGAPSIDEVITLKADAIDFFQRKVVFSSEKLSFPKHVMLDIQEYMQFRRKTSDLVFVNGKGEKIERAHFTNAFARASLRKEGDAKISPGMLLQWKQEETP